MSPLQTRIPTAMRLNKPPRDVKEDINHQFAPGTMPELNSFRLLIDPLSWDNPIRFTQLRAIPRIYRWPTLVHYTKMGPSSSPPYMLEAFNNERDSFKATLAQQYSFPNQQPQLTSDKIPRSKGATSMVLAGYSHTSQSTTASSTVPSMSYGRTLSSTSYVATSQASVVGQRYGFDEVEGVDVPRSSYSPAITWYECPFYFMGCKCRFGNNELQWMDHTVTHFLGRPLPQHGICWFCDMIFDNPDPRICWNRTMNHVAQHYRLGCTLANAKPDFCLMSYLCGQGIMEKRDYEGALPFSDVPSGYGDGELGPNSNGELAFTRRGQGVPGSSRSGSIIVKDPRRRGGRDGRRQA